MDKARRVFPEVLEDDKLEYLARLYARMDWLQTELDYILLKEDIEKVEEKRTEEKEAGVNEEARSQKQENRRKKTRKNNEKRQEEE